MIQAEVNTGTDDTRIVTPLKLKNSGQGKVLQHVIVTSSTAASTTNNIPQDSTIPQNTEGAEIMTLSITPKSTTSRLIVKAGGFGGGSNTRWSIALFKDSTANAIAVAAQATQVSGVGCTLSVVYSEISGSLTARTFKLRFGGDATAYFNQNKNLNTFGSIAKGFIDIEEVEV